MKVNPIHIDLYGRRLFAGEFDDDELRLVSEFKDVAARKPEWSEYSNYWMARVAEFYEPRGLSRREIIETPVYRIGQDLASRIAIDTGMARAPDYRDEIERIIRQRFRTRREFCQATGLSEDMLSHVLAKRKHLAIDTLAEALRRIGYALHVVPAEPIDR